MATIHQPYNTDISREQFEHIRYCLENVKKRTCPRKVDLYDVFCTILYILKGAVTWRNIPRDFSKKGIVRYHFDVWTAKNENGESVLDYVMAKLVDLERYYNRQNLPTYGTLS